MQKLRNISHQNSVVNSGKHGVCQVLIGALIHDRRQSSISCVPFESRVLVGQIGVRHEFRERKREYIDLHVSAGKQRCQLAGKQVGVRSSDGDVHVGIRVERVHGSLPLVHQLHLVEQQIIVVVLLHTVGDRVVQVFEGE